MTKLVINVNDENCEPVKGDLITFSNKGWTLSNHEEVFCLEQQKIIELAGIIDKLNDRITILEKHINKLANAIKEK